MPKSSPRLAVNVEPFGFRTFCLIEHPWIEPKITLKAQANGMAFRKSDADLRDYANTFIDEIVKNGELSKINERWFGIKLDELPPMPKKSCSMLSHRPGRTPRSTSPS